MENSVAFKDPMDRQIDGDLKKLYVMAGLICRPAVAATPISGALKSWTENMEQVVKSGVDAKTIVMALDEIKLTSDFLAESSVDMVWLSARIMGHLITSKWALWFWTGPQTCSKQALCSVPFNGKSLFGNPLEEAISRVTGVKSGLTPQDERRQQKQPFSSLQKA